MLLQQVWAIHAGMLHEGQDVYNVCKSEGHMCWQICVEKEAKEQPIEMEVVEVVWLQSRLLQPPNLN